ncbi:PREDICTED: C-type lectin domain family 12 member B [Chrysochloris asiatica]|uniref:C-type lectin domain family 12 member B n=1 Tax=Chrysochloris asiatica TaxID=185453 RepID=A0A9B0X1X0_CHRAS|nr:PREDICTED: C-type lectin domain family 12 member B [Chrysochloris asiatica]
MSEDVTYATLTFQNSAEAGKNRNRNNVRKRGYPAPSPIWRQAALSLITLCLLLLIGLVTLGIMYLQTSNEINSDSEKVSPLQKTVHQQLDNSSQQLGSYKIFPMEDDFLKSQISSLLKKQEQMAIKLCQELIIHSSDHKCNPCPKMWQWHQNSCYYFTTNEEKTWTDSQQDCMNKNSTLLKIDSMEEKDFLNSQPLPKFSFFWLGLSWDPFGRNWLWEDGSTPSAYLFSTKELTRINGSKGCAYFQKGHIYVSRCSAEISWICEKTAALVKIEDLS